MRKQLLIFTKIFLIITFLTVLTPFSKASARVGGNTSKSYSSSSSSSSFWGRRNYFGRNRYRNSDSIITYLAITAAALITFGPKIKNSLRFTDTHLNLSSRNKETVKKINSLSSLDSIWNINSLEFHVKEAFYAIQDGWAKRDINLCKDYLASNLLREYEYKIKNMIYSHQVNILEDIDLLKCMPIEVSNDNFHKKHYVSFYIKAKLRDYMASDVNGTLTRGNTNKMTFSEIWIFTLSEDRKWKLCEIQEV